MSKFNLGFMTRHIDIIPANKMGAKINIIGAGAIGTHTAMALARMGFGNMKIWDFDVVDPINMNCQGFTTEDAECSRPKVEALQKHINDAIGFTVEIVNAAWKDEELGGIVICAADSMAVRKAMWQKCKGASIFIDPRMGAEFAKLYVMRPNNKYDETAYAKTLYTDDEAVRAPCTAKSTIYTAYLLSGLVAKAVKDFVVEEPYTRVLDWDIRKNKMQSWNVS